MTIKNSNLYAEKIYAEHPLALWTLDDDISFLQLLTDSQQDLFETTLWAYTNLNQEAVQDYGLTPISQSPQSRFSAAASGVYVSELTSVFSVSSSSFFSSDKSTACFSAHIYQASIFIDEFEIGIEYDGEEESSTYSFGTDVEWHKISHTFEIPANKNITFFIRVVFSDDAYATMSDFEFQVNGVSLGQWSEQYNSNSIGFNDIELPSDIRHIVSSSSSYTCIVADAYGLDDSLNGYYLIKNKQIYAENSGLPLAFGSQNSTRITQADDNNPSIILPGMGFLNEAGRYNSYTLEAWIRLQNLSANKIKIIGPIFSEDGIYVEEGYLSVVVGGQCIKSYFVGKWYRPMLVHFKYNQNYVSVYINGEEVIFENIDTENINLPEYDDDGDIKDWIGVYGNSLVDPFEIDCISILPYDLPLEMAKRRFVYGQGVGDFELSNSIYKNETIFFDYANSEYATNLIYPDMNRWKDALAINLDTSSSYLTPIDYDLPTFQSRSSSLYTDWLEGNRLENINNPDAFDYFVMNPTSASSIVEPSLFYENINIINENLNSVIAVFKPSTLVGTEQPLMIFNNKSTYESLKIVLEPISLILDGGAANTISFDSEDYYGSASTQAFTELEDFGDVLADVTIDNFSLKYIYKNYIEEETTIYEETISASANFTAGINIESLKNNNFSTIGNFFSSLDNVSLTIGKDGSNNFEGKIYAIHFANSFTYEKYLSELFSDGIILQTVSGSPTFNTLINHTSTYSLIPVSDDCGFALDIGIFGYWEDMQPLSYFGKYVYNQSGTQYYDLDMIQINIDSPSSYSPQEDEETSIKSFVTFKHFTEATNKQYSSFVNTESLSNNSIIQFNSGQYDDTKYEFNDKTVIITPDEDFENYYLGIHLEVKVRGIKTKSFLVRRIELASLAFNDNTPTKIGSRYAEYISPFTRNGNTFDYKEINPLTIYKDTSPFLYLTDDSGLLCNVFDVGASATRGFYATVNENENDNYILGALQTWIRYPSSTIGNENIPLMSVVQNTASVSFYIEPEVGGQRGFIYAYDSTTGLRKNDIVFFQDGRIVDNPIIYPQRWTSINTSFLDPLTFDNYAGRIEFYEGILFNNISKYVYSNNAVNTFKEIFAKWYQVFYNDQNSPPVNTWAEIETPDGQIGSRTWRQATASLQSNEYTIDGQQIYNNQTGLSISVTDDTSRLNIYSNGSDIMTDVVWQTFEKSPV